MEEGKVMKIIFTGSLVSVIGVLLPWLSGTVRGALNIGTQTATGFELNQGIIGAGIAILGAILGYFGSQKHISKNIIGYVLIIISVAIFVVAFSVLIDPGTQTIGTGPLRSTIRYHAEFGVFVTLLGSLIIFAGALKIMLTKT